MTSCRQSLLPCWKRSLPSFPESEHIQLPARPRSYDLAGVVTVTAGLILLVYAMTQAQEGGATPVKTSGLLALALLILACFLLIERWSKAPLMPLSILRSRTLCAAGVASTALQGSVHGKDKHKQDAVEQRVEIERIPDAACIVHIGVDGYPA